MWTAIKFEGRTQKNWPHLILTLSFTHVCCATHAYDHNLLNDQETVVLNLNANCTRLKQNQ